MKTTNKMTQAIMRAGLVLLLASALTSTASAQNRIVFQKLGTGKSVGLYSMNADGSGLVQLTQHSFDRDPAWSPGQSYVAFVRQQQVGQGKNVIYTHTLYVMEAKGELNGGRIFAVASDGFEPDWSPDGTKILFRTLDSDIAVVSVDVTTGAVGTPVKVVATALHEYRPTWSPDGTRIAFARALSGNGPIAIFVRDLATGNEIQFPVVGSGSDLDPEWSPDGTRIAFDDTANIYVANADGSNLTAIFNGPGGTKFPTWSPDGAAIAFSSNCIEKIDLATRVVTQIPAKVCGSNPDWSP